MSYLEHRFQKHGAEQYQSGVAVRFEQLQAMRRVVDVEAHHLPGQMRGESDQPEHENKLTTRDDITVLFGHRISTTAPA